MRSSPSEAIEAFAKKKAFRGRLGEYFLKISNTPGYGKQRETPGRWFPRDMPQQNDGCRSGRELQKQGERDENFYARIHSRS
jgi:hypothetical protein